MRTRLITLTIAVCACAAWGGPELLVTSRRTDAVLRYDARTGSYLGVLAQGGLIENPNDLELGADGMIYLANGDAGQVLRVDPVTGAAEKFTSGAPSRFIATRGISFGPDGDLYAASGMSAEVLRFDGVTGAYVGVAASGNGMDGPVGLDFAADGTMYVGAALSNNVHVYRDSVFSHTLGSGARSNAVGVLAGDDGTVTVAYSVSNRVLRLDGTTGAIVQPLMRIADGAQIPIELEETPWGTLLVSSFGTSSVFEYDLTTGDFLGELVTPGLGGLDGAHGMLIIPAPATASLLLTVGLMACMRRRIG